jgi:peptidoglycan/xylan/chitin deacetylase (PgdA/CDA1 family)
LTFDQQISDLRSRQFVYLDDYDQSDPRHVVLTFDDAYENVYRHAFPILSRKGLPFEIFVIGDLIGDWNHFDDGEPLTRFAKLEHLLEMADAGGRIQWHTRSHRALPELTDSQVVDELTPPNDLRSHFPEPHLRWLAYPYGLHDDRSRRLARQTFTGAVAANAGSSTDRWQVRRVSVFESSRFRVFAG